MKTKDLEAAVKGIEAHLKARLKEAPPSTDIVVKKKVPQRRGSKLLFRGTKRYPKGLLVGFTDIMHYSRVTTSHSLANRKFDLADAQHRMVECWAKGQAFTDIAERRAESMSNQRGEGDIKDILRGKIRAQRGGNDDAPQTEGDKLAAALNAFDDNPEMKASILATHAAQAADAAAPKKKAVPA